MTLTLPRFETFEEGSQIRRSSKSIAAAIVEGYGRKQYPKDFKKHLIYAHSECDETILHLDFLFETKSFKDEILYKALRQDYVALSKGLYNFLNRIDLQ